MYDVVFVVFSQHYGHIYRYMNIKLLTDIGVLMVYGRVMSRIIHFMIELLYLYIFMFIL